MQSEKIKVQVLCVEQNVFQSKNDNQTISYTKFTYISGSMDDEQHFGSIIDSATCKYEDFNTIKLACKSNKLLEVEFKYIKQSDGSYKRKVNSIAVI